MNRAEKSESVASLKEVFTASKVVVVAHYSGLTVAQMQTLRKQMKLAGAEVKVAKNRLAKIALDGSDAASIVPLLKGPTLIAYSVNDPVAAPKVATDFAKANEQFVILGGAMGKTALDLNAVKQLASLPSLDELRAKIDRPHSGAGHQDRAGRFRTGCQGSACDPGLCQQRRGVTSLTIRFEQ